MYLWEKVDTKLLITNCYLYLRQVNQFHHFLSSTIISDYNKAEMVGVAQTNKKYIKIWTGNFHEKR
jgi:hypothetical protein